MVGKNHKSAVLVVTDRKSRFNKLRKLDGKHAKKVNRLPGPHFHNFYIC
jgi:IS30 family transposase